MRAIAGDGPKEMVALAGRPAIDWVIDECNQSGITGILIISAPGKDALVSHVSRRPDVTVVIQHDPRGLADAIRLGRDFADNQPLAVALPDNIFLGNRPALAQVIDGYRVTENNVVAVVEINATDAARRGATAALDGWRDGTTYRIS